MRVAETRRGQWSGKVWGKYNVQYRYMMRNRVGRQGPFGLSEDGVRPVVSNGAGCSSGSPQEIFGGGGGGGRLSSVFMPATSMGVGRQTTCLS
jgi:hypothetical protein